MDREKITAEFASVPSYQHADGSFSLWPGLESMEYALFLTNYVLLVNESAKEIGLSLPEETTSKAFTFIAQRLERLPNPDTIPAGRQNKPGDAGAASFTAQKGEPLHESPDSIALALRLLALHDPAEAKRLLPRAWAYCENAEINPLGLSSFLFALDSMKDASIASSLEAVIKEKLEKTAAVTATEMHFASAHTNTYWRTLGSSLRDNAYALGALTRTAPSYPRLEGLARWVGQRLGDMQSLSTQESVFGVWGLATYLQSLGGDQNVSVFSGSFGIQWTARK